MVMLFFFLVLILIVSPVAGSVISLSQAHQLFRDYNAETNHWVLGTGPGSTPKQHLQRAMDIAKEFIPWLLKTESLPPGISRMEFAHNALSYARNKAHIKPVIPLLEKVIEVDFDCEEDLKENRGHCKSVYNELIFRLVQLGEKKKAAKYVRQYNKPRPKSLRFESILLTNFQMPGIQAQPFWPQADQRPSLSILKALSAQFVEIRDEIVGKVTAPGFSGWNTKLDHRLSNNKDWQPQASWQGIQIIAADSHMRKGEKDGFKEGCDLFPVTCSILKSHSKKLRNLLPDTEEYFELLGRARKSAGWNDKPVLGVTIYQVFAKAGILPHCGQAGRLVHSLPLQAPTNPAATLTVAGETKPWVEGEWMSFDDSFVHSVSNPHPTQNRIVMTIQALHPDFADILHQRKSEL